MVEKQYIWVRNIALIIILCNIVYFRFPFAPIYWRVAMLLLGGYVFFHVRLDKITRFEVFGLSFLAMNLIYFVVGSVWLPNPYQTQLGNTIFCIMSLFVFCRVGSRGLVTVKFITISAILLVLASIPRYYYDMETILDTHENLDSATISISTLFMTILPMALIIRNKFISLPFLFVCISFIISSGKRGNALAAVIPILLFMILYVNNNRRRIFDYFIIIVAFIFTYRYAENLIIGSEFLQQRIEMTLEGNDSNRSIIYSNCWNAWYNSKSFVPFMFGYGWDGTLRVIGVRAHNDWLELLVNHGLIGASLYLLLLLSLLSYLFKVKTLQERFIVLAVFSIWLFKSLYSMGYTEEYLALIFIPLGYVFTNKSRNGNNNEY